jgi:hypothetical protein
MTNTSDMAAPSPTDDASFGDTLRRAAELDASLTLARASVAAARAERSALLLTRRALDATSPAYLGGGGSGGGVLVRVPADVARAELGGALEALGRVLEREEQRVADEEAEWGALPQWARDQIDASK